MGVPTVITCVECGGRAHLVSYEPPGGLEPGQVVVFACEDCHHRLDVVLDAGDGPEE